MKGIEDLVALANAGFSKDEILTIVKTLKSEAVETVPSSEEEKVVETKVETPKVEETKIDDSKLDELNATMNNLIDSMRLNAINNTHQPDIQSADDVLAAIINPGK